MTVVDNIHENDLVALLVDQSEAAAGVIVEFVDETGKIKTEHDIIDRAQIVKLRFHPTLEAA